MNSIYITMTIEEIRERWSGKMSPLIATNVAQKDVTFLLGIIEDMKCCGNCRHSASFCEEEGCNIDKYEECAESNEYSSWEAET